MLTVKYGMVGSPTGYRRRPRNKSSLNVHSLISFSLLPSPHYLPSDILILRKSEAFFCTQATELSHYRLLIKSVSVKLYCFASGFQPFGAGIKARINRRGISTVCVLKHAYVRRCVSLFQVIPIDPFL